MTEEKQDKNNKYNSDRSYFDSYLASFLGGAVLPWNNIL